MIFGVFQSEGKRNIIFEKCQPNSRLLVDDANRHVCCTRLNWQSRRRNRWLGETWIWFFFFFLVVTYLVDRVGGEIGWLGVGGGRCGRMKNEELIPNGTDEESTATVSIPVASSKCVPASLSFSLSFCWTTCTAKSCSWCRTSCLISPVTFCRKKGPLNKNLHIITNTYNS